MTEPSPLPDWAQWLVPGWAGFGPWVPIDDLTPEGQAIRAEFMRMLRWDRRAAPYLKEIVAELEKPQ